MGATSVAGIVREGRDSTDALIETVYAKVVPAYAVYRTEERVMVQYADDDALGGEQRRALIESNPVKGEINGLIDGWRKSRSEAARTRARLFDRRVADALVVALQGDQAHAVDLLNQIKADIVAERTSIARTSYLFTSCATTAVVAAIFGGSFLRASNGGTTGSFVALLVLSAAVGALGAFFSIALAIRGRQIGTDLQWRDNHTDAGLRVTIGAISGAVLYCLLHAKVVTLMVGEVNVEAPSATTALDVRIALVVITAFAAGFTERLVGDLLGRVALGAGGPASNPLAGRSPPVAGASPASTGTEKHPLGKGPPRAAAAAEFPNAAPPDDDDLRDGCQGHTTLDPDEMTRDVELPAAVGGIAGRA